MLFLRTERSLHRCRPHSSKFLPDKVCMPGSLSVHQGTSSSVIRISHLALIAGRIRVHRVKILHVWLPHLRKQVLLLLDLQLADEFHHNIIQQLVVRQRPRRIYYHIAEHLVANVAVQLFHQFRAAQSGVHLQEHQGYLAFWC